ncbi:hypothetical protein ABK040_011681 [Willaertia magna]
MLIRGDTIKLKLIKATNLIAADRNGLSDPYVIVRTERKEISNFFKPTSVIKKTLNPIWNETFIYYIYEKHEKYEFFLEVMDKDLIFDDFLGSAVVNVVDIVTEANKEFTVDLPLEKVKSGTLQISLFVERKIEDIDLH